RWVVEELPSCGRGPLVSSQPVPRGKNLMTHNIKAAQILRRLLEDWIGATMASGMPNSLFR
ncbi:hypothetical protein, partial [Micrococcus luteus]|uniref:hypothetical protein n=1 Tax=Micrococcus luteus TaxID=1270 RepID=UPI0037B599BB